MEAKLDEILRVSTDTNSQLTAMNTRVTSLESEVDRLRKENALLKNQLEEVDNNVRYKNLILGGLEGPAEEPEADTKQRVRNFFKEDLGLTRETGGIDVDKAFRLTNARTNPKPIFIKMISETGRDVALEVGLDKLVGSRKWIKGDMSVHRRAAHKQLAPFYDEAKRGGAKSVKVKKDFLLVDNVKYRYLPDSNKCLPVDK